MSRVFPVEALEDELCVGLADGDGAVAGGAHDAGVIYLEVVGAGAAPRVGGADCREDHEDVRPAEIYSSSPLWLTILHFMFRFASTMK
jgi:hypothetical protein